jgi:hypothetical protein
LLAPYVAACHGKLVQNQNIQAFVCMCINGIVYAKVFASWKGGGRQLELVMACYLFPPCILPSQETFTIYTIQEFSSFLCVVLVKKVEQFLMLAFIGVVIILCLILKILN